MYHLPANLIDTGEAVPSVPALAAVGAVAANVNYVVPPAGRNAVHVRGPGEGENRRTAEYVSTPVLVHDVRHADRPPTLDGNGFALKRQSSAVTDFVNDDEVREIYYPEMERLIRQVTGAREVVVFDHNVRVDGGERTSNSRMPVRNVHNDYTESSAPRRVRDLLGEQRADTLLKERFAIVNAWRSIEGTVQRAPLAVIDASSVRPADLVPTDLIYSDRVGEIYEVAENPAHRWRYYSGMHEDDVLFIKGYDSRRDVARFTPHTAFDHPGTLANAPPRKSIEVRSLVFF